MPARKGDRETVKKKIQGVCCNCKQEFPYSPEFCVDLVCQKCAAHLPEDITVFIKHNIAIKTMELIRKFVNSFSSTADQEDIRTILNTILDLGEKNEFSQRS